MGGKWREGPCACARHVAYHISGLAVHKGLHGYEEEETSSIEFNKWRMMAMFTIHFVSPLSIPYVIW